MPYFNLLMYWNYSSQDSHYLAKSTHSGELQPQHTRKMSHGKNEYNQHVSLQAIHSSFQVCCNRLRQRSTTGKYLPETSPNNILNKWYWRLMKFWFASPAIFFQIFNSYSCLHFFIMNTNILSSMEYFDWRQRKIHMWTRWLESVLGSANIFFLPS